MRQSWRELCEIVSRFEGRRVVVLGDLVLDRFWYGTVQRLSREAPVPIVRLTESRLMPGCAANTVWNLAASGRAVPVPVGVIGTDREGEGDPGPVLRAGDRKRASGNLAVLGDAHEDEGAGGGLSRPQAADGSRGLGRGEPL